jgi:glycosyltransferase involved in cell wall biosynthesis
VLALGRLHPKKGLEDLVRAFVAVAGPEWRLVVAGDGDPAYVAGLERLAADLGAGARILFTGWLEGGARAAVLRDAALLALPSRQENFGLSVVEALASGVPVLISEAVNLADDVRAAGAGWVAPLDPAALAAGLREALDAESERARRGKAGRELVERRFTWSRVGAELAALYRTLGRRVG